MIKIPLDRHLTWLTEPRLISPMRPALFSTWNKHISSSSDICLLMNMFRFVFLFSVVFNITQTMHFQKNHASANPFPGHTFKLYYKQVCRQSFEILSFWRHVICSIESFSCTWFATQIHKFYLSTCLIDNQMENTHLNLRENLHQTWVSPFPNDLGLGVPNMVLQSIDRAFSAKDNVVPW